MHREKFTVMWKNVLLIHRQLLQKSEQITHNALYLLMKRSYYTFQCYSKVMI